MGETGWRREQEAGVVEMQCLSIKSKMKRNPTGKTFQCNYRLFLKVFKM